MSKAQATNTGVPDSDIPADLEPVELDPPAPEIIRWQELVDRDVVIYHEGDAEKIIPFPRPAWADPDEDIIGAYLDTSYYTSEYAFIALEHARGETDDDEFRPAVLLVRAKLCGDGKPIVGLNLKKISDRDKKSWTSELGQGLTPAEALELADVLRAAVDLLGGVK